MDYQNKRKWLKKRRRDNRKKRYNNILRNKPMTEERIASHMSRQKTKKGSGGIGKFISGVMNWFRNKEKYSDQENNDDD